MKPPISMKCPYCGSNVSRVDSTQIYGRSYGLVYLCDRYPACDAYVGCHPDGTPKGTLANRRLRAFRKATHAFFDPLWKERTKVFESRNAAYQWLGEKMNLPPDLAHIATFDEVQCIRCIEFVKEKYND